MSVPLLDQLGVPRSADFYLCGPPPFLSDFTAGLTAWGIAASQLHSEIFGSGRIDDAWNSGASKAFCALASRACRSWPA